ncbi:hypothetical protein PInf_002823 [Phytophthora infestans]|nr:hypothetical protein PInf_002823 [Phytophthora infestans]
MMKGKLVASMAAVTMLSLSEKTCVVAVTAGGKRGAVQMLMLVKTTCKLPSLKDMMEENDGCVGGPEGEE